jgi:hypothetical protein
MAYSLTVVHNVFLKVFVILKNIHFWDWKDMLVGHIKPTLGVACGPYAVIWTTLLYSVMV